MGRQKVQERMKNPPAEGGARKGGKAVNSAIICIAISVLVILLNIIGTMLFSTGIANERMEMMRIGIAVIKVATITAVLNLSWCLVRLSLFA